MTNEASPRWDRKMQRRLEGGEAAALGELYDRFAPLVHSLAYRVLDDEEAANRTTREVFGHIWENPGQYEPRQGPMRSWIAELTQRLATARLRRRHRAGGPHSPEQSARFEEKVRTASTAARADYIVNSMPAPLRAALELAYFQRHDCQQTALRLGVTEDEARRRLRLGLQLLASAMSRPYGPSLTAGPEPAPPDDRGHAARGPSGGPFGQGALRGPSGRGPAGYGSPGAGRGTAGGFGQSSGGTSGGGTSGGWSGGVGQRP